MQQKFPTPPKILYQDNYTKILQINFKKSNGDIATRIIMDKHPFVVIVPINEQKQVLLAREFRVALQKTVWMVPTGYINSTETPLQAAKRELLEEMGLKTQQLILLYRLTGNSECRQTGFVFIATQLKQVKTTAELKVIPTDFRRAITMALQNKLGDRIGLAVIAAINKYKELRK